MPADPQQPAAAPPPGGRRWGRRLAWLLGLWLAGVATLGLAAWLLKGFMRWAGLAA
jgi:hypothetical protein